DTLVVKATRNGNDWNLRYLFADERSSEGLGTPVTREDADFLIPLSSKKGFKGRLRLTVLHASPAAAAPAMRQPVLAGG
ncbi:MAG TPA: hypothetical protein VF738_08310, partial [Rhodanobacter sp.]